MALEVGKKAPSFSLKNQDGAVTRLGDLEGKWVITLLNTTNQPALAQLKNRAVREKLFKASAGRGWSGTGQGMFVLDDRGAVLARHPDLDHQRLFRQALGDRRQLARLDLGGERRGLHKGLPQAKNWIEKDG